MAHHIFANAFNDVLFPNMLDIIDWDETLQSVYKVTKDQASKVSDLWWTNE